jgi:xylulokinase
LRGVSGYHPSPKNASTARYEGRFRCVNCLEGCPPNRGKSIDWFHGLFPGASGVCESDVYRELLKDVDSGKPGELLLVPHFSGVCNPVFNPEARGALYGLTLNTTSRDLAQSILEGLCYDLKSRVRGFREAGIPIEKLKAVGGGAQSDAWLQLKANITGLEMIRADIHDASAMGAAALCGKAIGALDDPYAASGLMGLAQRRFVPEPEAACRFEKRFARYLSLRERIGAFESC